MNYNKTRMLYYCFYKDKSIEAHQFLSLQHNLNPHILLNLNYT